MKISKILLFIVPIAIGIFVLVSQSYLAPSPQRTPIQEQVRLLRVIEVSPIDVLPRAIAYGRVQPSKTWTGIAQVKGEIIMLHPRVDVGSILLEGEIMTTIDPTDYTFAVQEIQANIQVSQANLTNLMAQESNLRASLSIEQRALELSGEELRRKQQLLERGTVSQASVEQSERDVLTARQKVQNLENSLALLPSQQMILEAQLAQQQIKLEQAQRDLDRTVIKAPFNMRIAQLHIEESQAVTTGQTLFIGEDVKTAEIEAQVPLVQLRPLVEDLPPVTIEGLTHIDQVPIMAIVRLVEVGFDVQWSARIDRFVTEIDPTASTSGVVVAVDNHYEQAIPGQRPPLFANMYVEVELRALPRPNMLIVPRTAIFGDSIYIIDSENRLQRRRVDIGLRQTNFIALDSGISSGDRVVVSDPTPAILGMLVEPIIDTALMQRLIEEAQGQRQIK